MEKARGSSCCLLTTSKWVLGCYLPRPLTFWALTGLPDLLVTAGGLSFLSRSLGTGAGRVSPPGCLGAGPGCIAQGWT